MNIGFLEIPKKFLMEHLEKILLAFLILMWIFVLGQDIASILREMDQQAEINYLGASSKQAPALNLLSLQEYESILKIAQNPMSSEENDRRNLFSKSSDETLYRQSSVSEKVDADHDGIPDEWETRYGLDCANSQDAQQDQDQDHYSNLDEYIGGSDPLDPNSFPGMVKLRVLKIFRQGVQVNFFGYIQLPDHTFQVQVNWGKQTAFLKVGQKIRGYQITSFSEETQKKFNPQINADEIWDASSIAIQKQDEPPITLVLGQPSFEKELYALIEDLATGNRYQVHAGSKINSYKVLDIDSSKVIISRDKKIYTLQRSTGNLE